VVDLDAAIEQHELQITVADGKHQIPSHGPKDHLGCELAPLEAITQTHSDARPIVPHSIIPELRQQRSLQQNRKLCYLWRAVDHEGEVLEAVVMAKRDKAAALKLLRRLLKRYRSPSSVTTGGLKAYSAAMNDMRSDAGSIIGLKTRISRFDDESERCSAFEA
jgi:IS1 family transposase